MKEISIVLPVYNVEKYLDDCIQSILNQSYQYFELIIINDGSTDSSGEISKKYAEKDQRVHVVHQENQGLSMARNKGIERAKSEYISFVDSDDALHPEYLEILYHNLIDNQADLSVVNYRLVDEEESYLEISKLPYTNEVKLLASSEAVKTIVEQSETMMIIACGKLYRKTLFEHINYPPGKQHEDEFVSYQLFYKAEKIVVNQAKLYFYRRRSDSITGNHYNLKRLDKLEALKEAIYFFEEKEEKELRIKARARYLLNIQIAYYKIKFEMKNEEEVMRSLKKEYKNQYRRLKKEKKKQLFFQSLLLAFFYRAPNLYSWLVKAFLRIKAN